MSPYDAFWHLANFFAPAVFVGALTALFVKLLWRHELRTVSWRRLSAWGVGGSALVLVGGLVTFGRDGKMLTYALMLGACAASLGWAAFGARR